MDTPKERPSVPPRVPPPLPPAPMGALDYARPRGARREVTSLPLAAGFFMGLALYVTVAAAWWGVAVAGGGLAVALWGLAGVPVTAIFVAAVVQAALGWRGIVAGVSVAFGLTFLVGFFGIIVICGGKF